MHLKPIRGVCSACGTGQPYWDNEWNDCQLVECGGHGTVAAVGEASEDTGEVDLVELFKRGGIK